MDVKRLVQGTRISIFPAGILLLVWLSAGLPAYAAGVFKTIKPSQADTLIRNHQKGRDLVILDVRTRNEYRDGFLRGAINLSTSVPGFRDSLAKLDKNRIYLVYCDTGVRSLATMMRMKDIGFQKVYNLDGGVVAWQSGGYSLIRYQSGAQEEISGLDLIIRVNPDPVVTTGNLAITGRYSGYARVQIINTIGSVVKEANLLTGQSLALNARDLSPGIYYYRVILPGNMVKSGKFQVAG